jgi:hypothetical protein
VLEGKLIPVDKEGNLKEDEAIELVNDVYKTSIYEGYHLAETLKYEFTCDKNIDRYDKWAITVRFVGGEQFESEYSEPKLVSTLAVEDPNQDKEGNLIEDDPVTEEKCSLCGFCSMPLGICVFTYVVIGVILFVAIVIAIFIIRKKKNESWY